MEPMNLLVARKAVADDMRRQLNPAPAEEPRRTTRITRHRLSDLFRRWVTVRPTSARKTPGRVTVL